MTHASWIELELTSLAGLKTCLEETRHDLEYYGTDTARCKRCFSLVQHNGISCDWEPRWDRLR